MSALNDVFMVTDISQCLGQECINVYFYRQNVVGDNSADDVLDSFEGQVLPAVLALQTDDVLHTTLIAQNLYTPSERASRTISEVGANTGGNTMNNFTAYGFSLNQDNGAIRNGSKRIVGVQDDVSVDGVITDATYIDLIADLAGVLATTLDLGIIATFVPTIVKRILVSAGEYRLPANSGEAVLGSVVEAVWNPLLTSQTSRKVGVGA